jgi:hypothetical protein
MADAEINVGGGNPFADLSDKEKMEKRKDVQAEIMIGEEEFTMDLDLFIQSFITPVMLRDTQFKRTFLSESSIAVTLNLYKDIYTASNALLVSLQAANSSELFSKAFVQFASSLQLFAQYASMNVACCNSLKAFDKQLRKYMKEIEIPEEMTVESAILSPLQHYNSYREQFQKLVWLTPAGRPELASFTETLEAVRSILYNIAC